MISAQLLTVYGKQNNFTPAVKFSSPSALWLRLRQTPSPESLRDVPYDSNLLGSINKEFRFYGCKPGEIPIPDQWFELLTF